jgi:DNA mismatch repair protein MutS
MSIHQVYFDITRNAQQVYGDKTIVLMQVGTFFEVYGVYDSKYQTFYGSKIFEISRVCDLAIAGKKHQVDINQFKPGENRKGELKMCGFQPMLFERHIGKLEEEGFTLLIYIQTESTTNSFHLVCPEWFQNMSEKLEKARDKKDKIPHFIKNDNKNGTDRILIEVISPGVSMRQTQKRQSNYIASLWVTKYKGYRSRRSPKMIIGIGLCNVFTGETRVYEFTTDWNITPSSVEHVSNILYTFQPREYLLVFDNETSEYLENYIGITDELIHHFTPESHPFIKEFEKQTVQSALLSKWYDIHDYETFQHSSLLNEYPFGTMAFIHLLNFLQEHNSMMIRLLATPKIGTSNETMILANHSLQQLNMTSKETGRFKSVEQWVNRCITTMGRRQLYDLLTHPTTNVERITAWYDASSKLWDNEISDFRTQLYKIGDIECDYRRVILRGITPRQFGDMIQSLCHVENILQQEMFECNFWDNILAFESSHTLRETREHLNKLCNKMRKYINIEQCTSVQGFQFEHNIFNYVKDHQGIRELCEMDKQYEKSKQSLAEIMSWIQNVMTQFDKRKATEYCKIHETDKKIYITMTKKRASLLKKECKSVPSDNPVIQELIHEMKTIPDIGGKSSCAIISPSLRKLCDEISEIREKRSEFIRREYYAFLDTLDNSVIRDNIYAIVRLIAVIDIVWNNIYIAKKYDYCRPRIHQKEQGYIDARQLRHILIEQIQENEIYIPNDVTLDNTRGFLVYGTNAVGKSSLIRSLGINVILAQSGLFVPCSEFSFSPFSQLFTRILGNDNIFKGLSTFMVEMTELNTILNYADEHSLVLGDELCSGTEIPSAISIFTSALEELVARNTCFMFATHFHELTKLESIQTMNTLKMVHLSVKYDAESDCLVYERKLKPGSGQANYGLEVCRSIHMPQTFLERANQIRLEICPLERGVEGYKKNSYSSKKIRTTECEVCGDLTTEIHHLTPQEFAGKDGRIKNEASSFHKNHPANLICVCEKCHLNFHKNMTSQGHRRVKTTNGYKIIPME